MHGGGGVCADCFGKHTCAVSDLASPSWHYHKDLSNKFCLLKVVGKCEDEDVILEQLEEKGGEDGEDL